MTNSHLIKYSESSQHIKRATHLIQSPIRNVSVRKTSELIWQDTQHQTLFHLIDQLKTVGSGIDVFTKLNDYAESHFSLEESYMLKLNYPRAKEHIKAHNKFRAELAMMALDQHEFDEQMRESLALFLREWLTRHIFGIDKDFEAFVLNSNYK